MTSSLSNFVKNLAQRIHEIRCKYGYAEYTNAKDDLFILKGLCCNTSHPKKFDKDLKRRFVNIYKFCNYEIINFF